MVNNISAVYTMNAVVAKDSPVLVLGNAYIQPGLSGSFSFVSTSDITISGPGLITTTYAAGSNLLSGTFSGGNVVTNRFGSSGASFASGINGSDISFTSDFLTIDAMAQLDRATSLTAIAPTAFTAANGALRSFRAVTGGQFSAEPNPIPAAEIVPEPASWAMLIAGFSLVGVAMRRRKRALVA
ncbi:PEPxxWA-CTERM sorting domain-containing protein [Polymorphobacter fuscus]|uniref:PEPxxWA-CTERM sorting domain-containing protein n=2 Tax=Sandarakinorhabdus fusca TaxID=1439888 RepID=A0A7C9LGQ7_9SPHN|nr:PEP-CTERM sorting domain-containing protein [Polymorphobacter fuscus]MQT17647.1 PEPxxWA-CTERM sorting domain-containing protein [Polymorphobacter fuscus]